MYICVLYNTVTDTEGLDETSVVELETTTVMNLNVRSRDITTSHLKARRIRDTFSVYLSSDVGRLREKSLIITVQKNV
jgi:hypothetical protein